MPYSLQEILIFLPLLPEALAVATGIARYRKLQPPLRYLLALVVFALTMDIVFHILSYQKIPNLLLIAVYIPVEFGLLAAMYRHILAGKWIKKIVPLLVAGLAGFIIIEKLMKGSKSFSPEDRFLESVFVLIFVLLYFYQTLKNLATYHLERTPMFWVSAGLFIYFACDIIIFIFSNYVLSYSKQLNMQIWALHSVLNIILYLFYTLALWISPKN